jgi:hypothetical protein
MYGQSVRVSWENAASQKGMATPADHECMIPADALPPWGMTAFSTYLIGAHLNRHSGHKTPFLNAMTARNLNTSIL